MHMIAVNNKFTHIDFRGDSPLVCAYGFGPHAACTVDCRYSCTIYGIRTSYCLEDLPKYATVYISR